MTNITRNTPQNGTNTRRLARPKNPSNAKPTPRVAVAPERLTVKQAPRTKPARGGSYPWR